MAELWIDEDHYDVPNTKIVIEDGTITIADLYEITELDKLHIKMSVKPGKVRFATRRKDA